MAFKHHHRISAKQLFSCLMVLSVICLLLPRRITDHVDHVISALLGPLSHRARQLSLEVTDQLQRTGGHSVSAQEHQALKERYDKSINILNNTRQELRRQQELNLQLSGLHQEFGLARANLIVAHVIGTDSTSWSQRLHLDRGSLHHLQAEQLALAGIEPAEATDKDKAAQDIYQMSVVGKLKDVGLKTANLQLITDSGCSLPVVIIPRWDRDDNWRAEGQLYGTGMGQITVRFVSAQLPVQPGDAVMACSNPRYLPTEMIIGRVQSSRRSDKNPVVWEITVKPAADLHSLRQVVVVDTKGN